MIRSAPITHDIRKLIPEAEIYLKSREDIHFAYLFGSFARGSTSPLSDLDIAVYLAGAELADKRMEILGDLIDIFKTETSILERRFLDG